MAIVKATLGALIPGEWSVRCVPGDGPVTVDTSTVEEIWPELLLKVGRRSKPTMVLLQNASVRAIEGNTLVLALPTAGLARQLGQEPRAEIVKTTLRKLIPAEWQLRCVDGNQ